MKKHIKNMAVIGAVLLSTTAISAGAMLETGGYDHEIKNVDLMDTNGDNQVSNEEYTKFYEGHFEALDINRDGVLSTNEWTGSQNTHEVTFQSGGYQNQAIKDIGERSVTRKAFLEYHRSFIEATNQKRAEKQDPQSIIARLLGG
ncbi:hypothetical protein [Methylotenera sp.]|uniref:hypothetical protein n=1 Tax=Methylotenera sp. TaxID=2051956 RepID=UPI0027344FB6|nr:hypothetical protein [Methylotenera sp.]MDP3307073.1 hypothetical protein [Methylotenera sp.]